MGDPDFVRQCDALLDLLCDRIEDAIGEQCELDSDDGSLQVRFPDGRMILFNRNAHAGELWLSSPVGGGCHFVLRDGVWRDTRTGEDLMETVSRELEALAGRPVPLGSA